MVRGVNSATGQQPISSSRNSERDDVLSRSGARVLAVPRKHMLRSFSWTLVFAGVVAVSASLGATIALLTPLNFSQPSGASGSGFGELFRDGF